MLLILISLTGCLTGRKLDKEVANHYGSQLPAKVKEKDYISVFFTITPESAIDKISISENKTSNMLPLLVYWQWDYTVTCTLNPLIPISNFKKTVLAYAEKGLKQKLNGKRIELSIEKTPNSFAIVDKAHLIWIIYAIGWDNIFITPVNKEMVVSYKLMENDKEIKKGTITISSFDEKMKLGMFKSWKKATSEYLYLYDTNITAISKQVVDKLIEEL